MPSKKEVQTNCLTCDSKEKGIFCHLQESDLEEISANKVTNIYKKGQTLFFQGNPPYGLYCMAKGKVKVSKIGNDGKESIVRIAVTGDVLGHRSLFTDEYYTATATAIEDSTICFIDKKYIIKSMKKNPVISFNIIEKLSRDLGAAEKKVASLFQKNVRERLAELLLLLKESYGIEESSGRWKLDIKLTREEMASMIGVANETLIRFMTEFKDEKLVEQEGKIIYIIDEQRLLEFADLYY